jgi:hypothetical protein
LKTVVVSQPMFFPWRGIFEQIMLADIYVHYDDVQFSKGSFTNRVQVKTGKGSQWLTVPLSNLHLGQKINEVKIDDRKNWRQQHVETLSQAYKDAPFTGEMLGLVLEIYDQAFTTIAELSMLTIERVCGYFDLLKNKVVHVSSRLDVGGRNYERVLSVVKYFEGTRYVTGHGAKKYMDHELFEKNEIGIEYMDYALVPYPQQHGAFNPYVTILDLIANTGKEGIQYLQPKTKNWKEFIHE